jgi:hypothetical protein
VTATVAGRFIGLSPLIPTTLWVVVLFAYDLAQSTDRCGFRFTRVGFPIGARL